MILSNREGIAACKCGSGMRRRGSLLVTLVVLVATIQFILWSKLDTDIIKTYWYNFKITANFQRRFVRNSEHVKGKTNENGKERHVKKPVLPMCNYSSANLGPVPVDKSNMHLQYVEEKYPEVSLGGQYAPPNCTAKYKVAIIVPYRDRENHLAIFLNHMHPFLMKQQLEYGIFVIEQDGDSEFNRGKLFNVGFIESNNLKEGEWQCFVFHDVDLLPMDGRNLYSCPRQPRHMSASVDKLDYQLPYNEIFGGVSAMTHEQFTKVNGFSNKFWGWGAEDDDMSQRLKTMGYQISRYSMSIARYAMLWHKDARPNPKRALLLALKKRNEQRPKDGLSTLNYNLVQVKKKHLYTLVTVDIDAQDDL